MHCLQQGLGTGAGPGGFCRMDLDLDLDLDRLQDTELKYALCPEH